jgi:hypothetical protein
MAQNQQAFDQTPHMLHPDFVIDNNLFDMNKAKARNAGKNLVYDTADISHTQPLSPQANRLSEASRFLSEQAAQHSPEGTRDGFIDRTKKSKALSPV